jgi:hypothetical protein
VVELALLDQEVVGSNLEGSKNIFLYLFVIQEDPIGGLAKMPSTNSENTITNIYDTIWSWVTKSYSIQIPE